MPSMVAARQAQTSQKPTKEKIGELLKRIKTMMGERDKWAPHLRDAYDLFMPNRGAFKMHVAGAKRNTEVLDSTPVRTLRRWANRKQAQLMPANKEFARLVGGMDIPEEFKQQAAELLESQTDRLFAEINNSNLFDQVNEAMQDAGISTGAIHVADGGSDETPVRYTAVPIDELLLENGPTGQIENVFRTRKMTKEHIARNWPLGTIPDSVKDVDEKIEIVEGQVFNAVRGDFDYVVIALKAEHLIWHEVMAEKEWVVFRAGKSTGETYGRGPALDALPDARTLQRVEELVLRNAALAIAGVYTAADDDVLNVWNVTLAPGAIIPVARHDSLKPLESAHDFSVADLIRKELQESIEETMEAVAFGPPEGGVRSATEILKVDQQIAEDTGASSARLQHELVDPVVRLTVARLIRRARMAPFRLDNRQVAVRFEGPLARAQDNEEILRATTFLEVTAGLDPNAVAAAVDLVAMARNMAKKTGVWAETVRSEEESDQIQRQAAEAAAQQLQAQQAGGEQQAA